MSSRTVTVRGKPESPVAHPTIGNASPMRFVGLQFVGLADGQQPDPAKSFAENYYRSAVETVPCDPGVMKALKRGDLVEEKNLPPIPSQAPKPNTSKKGD